MKEQETKHQRIVVVRTKKKKLLTVIDKVSTVKEKIYFLFEDKQNEEQLA